MAIFPFKLNFNYRTIYLQRILNSRLDTRETQIDSRAFNNGEEFVYKLKAERKKNKVYFFFPSKKELSSSLFLCFRMTCIKLPHVPFHLVNIIKPLQTESLVMIFITCHFKNLVNMSKVTSNRKLCLIYITSVKRIDEIFHLFHFPWKFTFFPQVFAYSPRIPTHFT